MAKFDNLAGARYCSGQAMNWHGAMQGMTGRMFRCGCFRSFRLPDGKLGPNGYSRRYRYKDSRTEKKWNADRYLDKFAQKSKPAL